MTEKELNKLCENLIKTANHANAETAYLNKAISICKELVGCDKNFDAENVLIYLEGLKTKSQEIFDSARNFYNLCADIKGDVEGEMEQTIGKATRILSGKIDTYRTGKEKLLKDFNFKKYIDSKIKESKTNKRTTNQKEKQTQEDSASKAANTRPAVDSL